MSNEHGTVSQTKMKELVLELMVNTISDPKSGIVPEQFANAFKEFQTDNEGYPYLQTLAGIVSMAKDKNELTYSPNFGYHAEQVAIETANLCRLADASEWDLIVQPGHFITPDGNFLSGTMGYNAWRAMEQNMIINEIKRRATEKAEENAAPKIILPDTRIVKPQ